MEEFLYKWQNLIIGVLLALAFAYGTYNYLYLPKLKEIAVLKATLQLIDSEIKTVEGAETLLKDLNAAKIMLDKELEDISKKVPSETESPYVVNNFISAVGKGLNIDYNLIQPSGVEQEQNYRRLPLNVEFEGDYADLNSYLAQLKGLPVTIRVDSVELRKIAGGNKLAVSMRLSAFLMPGGAVKPPGAAKGYSYLFDPFREERVQGKASKPEGVAGLRYSGYFSGRVTKAVINDETLSIGESILGFRVTRIYKDRVVLTKAEKPYVLYLKEK